MINIVSSGKKSGSESCEAVLDFQTWVRLFSESEIGFVIPDHMEIIHYQRENRSNNETGWRPAELVRLGPYQNDIFSPSP